MICYLFTDNFFFCFSESLDLYYFNKTESDIWLRENFHIFKQRDKRFSVTHILSEADSSWTGEKGKVSKELVKQIAEVVTFIFVCGPPIFNDITAEYIGKHQVESHFFQG